MSTKIATAAAVAAIGVGASATAASAYTIDPPSTHFTGVQTSDQVFALGGAPFTCTSMTATGDTPASGGTVAFRAAYDGCTLTVAGAPFTALVTTHSDWDLTVTGGTGPFTGSVAITGATPHAVEISIPSLGCSLYLDAPGNGALSTVVGANASPTGVNLSANVTGISYTNSGCPGFPLTGNDATYTGNMNVPGITVTN